MRRSRSPAARLARAAPIDRRRSPAPSARRLGSASQPRALLGGLEVDGNGEVHVQQDRLDQTPRATDACPVGAVLRRAAISPWASLAAIEPDQRARAITRIAADVPARLQPDARMRSTHAHLGDVVGVEVLVADRLDQLGCLRAFARAIRDSSSKKRRTSGVTPVSRRTCRAWAGSSWSMMVHGRIRRGPSRRVA